MSHDHHEHRHHHDSLDDLLDLDAVVLAATTAEVHDLVETLRAGRATRRILDLGAGTGTGSLELARRFPDAEVVAVDVDADRLARAAPRAEEHGLRVTTRAVDLDAPWPDLGTFDLAWSSLAMHHLADPDQVLRDVHGTLAPGGSVVVVEMDDDLTYLPTGTPDGDLERRLLARVTALRDAALPAIGSDWGDRLRRAGFADVEPQALTIDVRPPHGPEVGRYAHAWFSRVAPVVDEHLDGDEQALLHRLLGDGPDGLRQRGDLVVAGRRTAWAAMAG